MGAFLDKPKTDKHYEQGSGNGLRYALCSMQGWRIDMEDAHTALTGLGAPFDEWSFFGVFDGHAGGKVSKFCAEHMVRYVMETEEFQQLKDENLPPEKQKEFIKNGLIRGFLNLDEFMRKLPDVVAGEDRSGSTAICALVCPETIYLANCGDSRGLIISKELVAVATYDHKPVNPKERERIQNAGGSVMIQRVNGSLAVSRALGDFEYKRVPNMGPFEQLISPEPEISEHPRHGQDEFILLACDGVWDVMSNEDVCQFVRYQLTVTDNLERICEGIVDNCLNKGSRDNISVVLITLPGAPHISEEARKKEEALDSAIEAIVGDMLKDSTTDSAEMDVTTLTHQVSLALERKGVTFPPGGGMNAKRHVIEKVWHELRPNQELRQEPGRPSNAAVMGFFRAKQVSTGGLAGPGITDDDDPLSLPDLTGAAVADANKHHNKGDFDVNPPASPVPPISIPPQSATATATADSPMKDLA
ncbi:Protein phosphatase 1B [Hypsibius exemplaris]|uniref:Protein phosphatase 1B n=1 Tax=Hypsibius exemplaris TaxID=2072580 RepID=A0A1W0WZG4_HYPEX|nr:Protein phosphatase 1B [Hypsibius exemplaris]